MDKNDAVTTSALKQCLKSSYTPSPEVIDLFEVWDAKQGLSEYIDDIHYHTQPHHFRFLLVDGRVQITYKHWCEDPWWEPCDENEGADEEDDEEDDGDQSDNNLYILKENYTPLSAFPLISPDLNSLNLDAFMADLAKLPPDYLSEEKKEEWEEFIEKLHSSGVTVHNTKPLPELSSIDEREEPPTISPHSAGAQLPPSIRTLIDKENKRTPVS